jgi:hypothetical protein
MFVLDSDFESYKQMIKNFNTISSSEEESSEVEKQRTPSKMVKEKSMKKQ